MATSTATSLQALRDLYADNFVLYYKSHGFHFNVEGATFAQDHTLLNELYDFLWDQHDMLGEQIRQMDSPVVPSLKEVLSTSTLDEVKSPKMTSKEMFSVIVADIGSVMEVAQYVFDRADAEGCGGLNTLVGDYLKGLSKLNWKFKATLNRSMK